MKNQEERRPVLLHGLGEGEEEVVLLGVDEVGVGGHEGALQVGHDGVVGAGGDEGGEEGEEGEERRHGGLGGHHVDLLPIRLVTGTDKRIEMK